MTRARKINHYKPEDERKISVKSVRMTSKDEALVARAAKAKGVRVSMYILRTITNQAKKDLGIL